MYPDYEFHQEPYGCGTYYVNEWTKEIPLNPKLGVEPLLHRKTIAEGLPIHKAQELVTLLKCAAMIRAKADEILAESHDAD